MKLAIVRPSLLAGFLLLTGSALAAPSVIVKPGDTLSAIARREGVTVQALRTCNKLTDETIHPGQTLRLPAASAAKPARNQTQSTTSTVLQIGAEDILRMQIYLHELELAPGPLDAALGDQTIAAMARFAQKHHLEVEPAMKRLLRESRAHVPAPCVKARMEYDASLSEVARRFNTSLRGLARINRNLEPKDRRLKAGSSLYVPCIVPPGVELDQSGE